jgi:hypothetical protein
MLKAESIAGYPASEVDQNSDYEIERGKPMPNRIHGTLQSIINMLLSTAYKSRFHFPNETALL